MSKKIIEGPELKTPVPNKSLGQLFFDCAAKFADNICQVDGTIDQTETYGSMKQRSTRVAIRLQERGITPKDVVAFCSSNTLDTAIPILATFYVGAKVANLEPSLPLETTKHLISLVVPKIIFVQEKALDLIEQSLKEIGLNADIIVYEHSDKYCSLSDLVKPVDGEADFKPKGIDANETAVMFFSSGTTGLPKAVCHTHRSGIIAGCMAAQDSIYKRILISSPFYWISAMLVFIQMHMVGGCRLFLRSLEPESLFKTISKYKVDTAFFSSSVMPLLTSFEVAKDFDMSSLRLMHIAGGTINPVLYQKTIDLFKSTYVTSLYGISEAGIVAHSSPEIDGEIIRTKTTSCGRPYPGVRIKIVSDETNEAVGPNQVGEICIKTPGIFKGYLNIDSSALFDSDGFYKTGDVGYFDEDDFLYIIDRKKDIFKYKGFQIVPLNIESVLLKHQAVKEAIVFGIPSNEDGELPTACVVLKHNSNASEEEIVEFVAERVSDREKLRGGVTFMESLPKTVVGKPKRKEIRDFVIKSKNR